MKPGGKRHRLAQAFRTIPPRGDLRAMLRVTGRLRRENQVIHVVSEEVEDISAMLDDLLRPDGPGEQMPLPLSRDTKTG